MTKDCKLCEKKFPDNVTEEILVAHFINQHPQEWFRLRQTVKAELDQYRTDNK